jgi:hypothetical protein
MPRQQLGVGLTDAADAERIDKPGQRNGAAGFDGARQIGGGEFAPALAPRDLSFVVGEFEDVGGAGDQAGGVEIEDGAFAEAVNVEGRAGCASQVRPPVQRRTTSPAGRTARLPQTGQWVRGTKGWLSAGRRLRSTATICGMTSPARWRVTLSPTRMSLRAISSSLCSVARVTRTPPTLTGSSSATGVSAPVRPTWMRMSRRMVCACSAGNFQAVAQRGARPTKPSRRCKARSSSL